MSPDGPTLPRPGDVWVLTAANDWRLLNKHIIVLSIVTVCAGRRVVTVLIENTRAIERFEWHPLEWRCIWRML